MDRDQILATLRAHQAELQAEGLLHLRLFGSAARNEQTLTSDIDLLFDYDESAHINLLRAYGFEDRLAELIGGEVHLSSAAHLRAELRKQVFEESIVAF